MIDVMPKIDSGIRMIFRIFIHLIVKEIAEIVIIVIACDWNAENWMYN